MTSWYSDDRLSLHLFVLNSTNCLAQTIWNTGQLADRHPSNSAPVELGTRWSNSAPIKFGTRWTRHLLNSAPVKLGTYTFKSMCKQNNILNVNFFPLKLDLHFNINFLTVYTVNISLWKQCYLTNGADRINIIYTKSRQKYYYVWFLIWKKLYFNMHTDYSVSYISFSSFSISWYL